MAFSRRHCDYEDICRANNFEAFQEILPRALALATRLGKTHYRTAFAAMLSWIWYWRDIDHDMYRCLLEKLCELNEVVIEYEHSRLSAAQKVTATAEETQRKAKELDMSRGKGKQAQQFYHLESPVRKYNRTARGVGVDSRFDMLIAKTVKFIRSMFEAVLNAYPVLVSDSITLDSNDQVCFRTPKFGRLYSNQLSMALSRPSYSVVCQKWETNGREHNHLPKKLLRSFAVDT